MNRRIIYLMTLTLLLISNQSWASEQCVPEGQWLIPSSGKTQSTQAYFPQLENKKMILLGEHHANAAHHQWQLALLKQLYAQNPNLIIGLEMFPRRMQPLLDQWVNKQIDKAAFIKDSEWDKIWAYDFSNYYPLFLFARDNHIPLVAINVDKSLLKMVRKHGWKNIPEQHRQGIGNPAKPTEPYVRQLAISFQGHYSDPSKITKTAFLRFVQQQLLWDRAMAEALASTAKNNPNNQIVGIMGSWHIINGHGVPFQLRSVGINNMLTLVPWDDHLDCQSINQQFADAIYGTQPTDALSFSAD